MAVSRKGFTLIELLVVISIIALLIAILLPALGTARKSARRMLCLSNNRQMGIGHTNYAGDFKGWLPPHAPNRSPHPALPHPIATHAGAISLWEGAMNPHGQLLKGFQGNGVLYGLDYLDDPSMMFCPSWRGPQYGLDDSVNGLDGIKEVKRVIENGSGGFGRGFVAQNYNYRASFGMGLSPITGSDSRPARLGETGISESNTPINSDVFVSLPSAPRTASVEFGHQDMYNVLYLDGHAAAFEDSAGRVSDTLLEGALNRFGYGRQENIVWLPIFGGES